MTDDGGVLLVGARLLLSAVFGLAGVAKLADLPGSRRAMAGFGVPAPFAGALAVLLPIAELAVALALLLQPLAVAGAAGAFLLAVVFIAAVGRSLSRGLTPDCHCFGQIHSEPVGARTLVRNSALAALAGFVVAVGWSDPGPDPLFWLGPFALRLLVLGVILAGLWWFIRDRAVRQPAAGPTEAGLATAGAGLVVGTQAPGFSLRSLAGDTVTLDALRAAGRPVVLLFSDPACGPCGALLPEIARWAREHAADVTLVMLTIGADDLNRAKLGAHAEALPYVLLQREREVAAAYGALATPAAVLVRADGTIGSALAQGARAVRDLVTDAVGEMGPEAGTVLASAPALPVSSLAPDFTRTDLDGQPASLSQYRGRPVLVLFWSPVCGFCQRMLRQLQAWEGLPPEARPELIVVSKGTVEENRASGLRSTVVIDQDFLVGRQYGVRGTPTGVLVDAGGRVARAPAVGAAAILEAIGFRRGAALRAEARPRRRDHVDDELLSDGSMVIYSGALGRVFTLNGTAALAWDGCDGTRPIAAIVAEVRQVFPSAADVEGDIRELLDSLLDQGLISIDTPGEEERGAVAMPRRMVGGA